MNPKQKKMNSDNLSDHPVVQKKLNEVNAILKAVDKSKLDSLLKGQNLK
jgi:hypothetical protein